MKKKYIFYIILTICVALVLSLGIFFRGSQKAHVTVYGTSTDPQTIQVLESFFELDELLGSKFELDFIPVSIVGESGKISSASLFNDPEYLQFDVAENQIQHIVRASFPDRFLSYVALRKEHLDDTNSDTYVREAGINFEKVRTDLENNVGKELLIESSREFLELQNKENFSSIPMVYINDILYTGSLDARSLSAAVAKPLLRRSRESLSPTRKLTFYGASIRFPWSNKSIAGLYECYADTDCADKPGKVGECADVGTVDAYCAYSDPALVTATVINDEKCVSCFTEKAVDTLKKDFGGLEVREIDLDSDEARSLIESYAIDGLPAIVFDENVEQSALFDQYIESGLFVLLSEQDRKYLHTQTEARKLLDRPFEDNLLHVFVNAFDPASIEVEKALLDLQALKEEQGEESFTFKIHHVLVIEQDEKGDAVQLPRTAQGEAETNESIRQAVMAQFFPNEFEAYLRLRNENLDRSHEEILEEIGVSAQSFNNIVEQQGEESLFNSAALSAELNVQVAPYFLWENQSIVIRVEDLKKIDMFNEL